MWLPICWLSYHSALGAPLQLLHILFWLLSVVAIVYALQGLVLILLPGRRWKSWGACTFLGTVAYLAISGASFALARQLHFHEMRRIISSSRDVVASIRSFEKAHGVPPRHLNEAVPSHIRQVPGPWHAAEYDYYTADMRNRSGLASPWSLVIDLPILFFMGEERLI